MVGARGYRVGKGDCFLGTEVQFERWEVLEMMVGMLVYLTRMYLTPLSCAKAVMVDKFYIIYIFLQL